MLARPCSPVGDVQPQAPFDTASLLESLICHETIPFGLSEFEEFEEFEEFDNADWAAVAMYVSGVAAGQINFPEQGQSHAERAW